jgi:hypothetical protein
MARSRAGVILRDMTAEPVPPARDPGRNPAAIRDALPHADRADFERFYAGALDEAKRTYTLEPVESVLEQWRRIVILSASPGHAEAMEHARRLLAGEDAPVIPADLTALRG